MVSIIRICWSCSRTGAVVEPRWMGWCCHRVWWRSHLWGFYLSAEFERVLWNVSVNWCFSKWLIQSTIDAVLFCFQYENSNSNCTKTLHFSCLDVKREYYQNCSVLDCVTQCSQSAAHLYDSSYRSKRLGSSHWDPYVMRINRWWRRLPRVV